MPHRGLHPHAAMSALMPLSDRYPMSAVVRLTAHAKVTRHLSLGNADETTADGLAEAITDMAAGMIGIWPGGLAQLNRRCGLVHCRVQARR